METKDIEIINYGILTSISWNSNNWAGKPTEKDLKTSKYDYVKDNAHMHESLNFGHDKYPAEDNGYYIGYTPMFNRPPSYENSKNVQIVFFMSSNYRNSNRKTIIGFYGRPIFGSWINRLSEHELYEDYDSGNIMALPQNIIYFDNPIIINNETAISNKLLPIGKKISQQGFNYLNSNNVYNLISIALKLNPDNTKLRLFVNKFPLQEKLDKEEFDMLDFIEAIDGTNADTLKDIEILERKMKNKSPEIKYRISSFIERGTIANRIKKLTNYKCLICEKLYGKTNTFNKVNEIPYVETHHVEPVSKGKKGLLSITNLITVCANHHRQLHYGKSKTIENAENYFIFEIDETHIKIEKINIS